MKTTRSGKTRGATGRRVRWMIAVIASLGWICLVGCQGLEDATRLGSSLGVASGVITQQQAESIVRSGEAVGKTFRDFTPEQEYYIGRAVAATLLDRYPVYRNPEVTRYINVMGAALAAVSDLPETFNGYHFLVLDADEINAFAAPGGLIFVTRGLLRCCPAEAAVAAVLAHEIGHVQERHGLQAIRKGRVANALTTLAVEGLKTFGDERLVEMTRTFEGSISDITTTLINSGYSREFEKQADLAAVTILKRLGYNPTGLLDMLRRMDQRLRPGGLDFAKTHPSPQHRIRTIMTASGSFEPVTSPESRKRRFERIMGAV